jgi:hypothetical protein
MSIPAICFAISASDFLDMCSSQLDGSNGRTLLMFPSVN